MSATVIIPTTGSPELKTAIESVLNQTYKTNVYIVVDGRENSTDVLDMCSRNYFWDSQYRDRMNLCVLSENVGANGFYGHRIYAAFTHLINTEYVLYLDQDCWFEPDHVEKCLKTIKENDLQWTYSLRSICDENGEFICRDDCESLGPNWPEAGYAHVDTNCYCLKTDVANKIASVWHGKWGQDRVFLHHLYNNFPQFDCTGDYTVNYRLGGNEGSVKSQFFLYNNVTTKEKYIGDYPWQKIW